VPYLPTTDGKAASLDANGALGSIVDADLAESRWCLYLWPESHGPNGKYRLQRRHTRFVNERDVILRTEDPGYSGANARRPGAAYTGGGLDAIAGGIAEGKKGPDGNLWTVLE
jgi:hypothetical protein